MASEVEICNVALSHLGDTASVASLSPPEGSAQAEHCARFYPIARDSLLEMHDWGFASRRVALAQLTSEASSWAYAYACPSDLLRAIAVLDPGAGDDTEIAFSMYGGPGSAPTYLTPQPFTIETLASGARVVYTNQASATLRYTRLVTDTTQFSPLFTMALGWHLASMLAGPVIKGDVGRSEGQRCTQMMTGYLSAAKVSDANQRRVMAQPVTPWLARRG